MYTLTLTHSLTHIHTHTHTQLIVYCKHEPLPMVIIIATKNTNSKNKKKVSCFFTPIQPVRLYQGEEEEEDVHYSACPLAANNITQLQSSSFFCMPAGQKLCARSGWCLPSSPLRGKQDHGRRACRSLFSRCWQPLSLGALEIFCRSI